MPVKFIKRFFLLSGVFLGLCILAVVIFDPFFQYHKPLPGLKAVLTDKEYQCIGTLRHFDYDSVIVGSSVCENYNNGWFDEGFSCTSIKAIRSYGATADLCYLMDIAFEGHEIKNIFYNLDPASLTAEPETTFALTGCPMYLYDTNYLNDVKYWLNKDVLMEKIPYLVAHSLLGDYDEGNSYNWAQWKEFNSDMILGLYIRKRTIEDMKAPNCYQDLLDKNLQLLTSRIEAHPETDFYIFVPPYSMLWWDNLYREGETESYLYNMEQAMATLLNYENVRLYYFQNDTAVITNLENYMDNLHFSPDINHYICDCLIADTHRMTKANYQTEIENMRRLAYQITNELVKPYEDVIKVDIYD